MGAYIGIDLGTTYSAISMLDETGRPIIIKNHPTPVIIIDKQY